jgi:hypothetical protein
LTLALATTTAARIGVSVVLVAYLTARGYPLRQATLLAGLVGVLQVVGRLLIAKERGRMPEHRGHIAAFLAQGIGCLLPLTTNGHAGPATATVVAFVLLLGLGFGLPALLRGTLLVDYYGSADYPRTNGVLGAWMVAAQAVGPLLTGAALGFGAGYRLILLAASALFGLGAVALLAAHRAHTGRPRRPAALREDSGKKGPRHASDHGRQR